MWIGWQVPFLSDDDGAVEIFESGAILLYLADRYGQAEASTPQQRAAYTKWVVWANSTLDGPLVLLPLCAALCRCPQPAARPPASLLNTPQGHTARPPRANCVQACASVPCLGSISSAGPASTTPPSRP